MGRHPLPLAVEQIATANRLHSRLSSWEAADQALEALARRFPGFDGEAALLKAITVNSLYYTNVMAIVRMAKHVEAIMSVTELDSAGPELVERLADLPRTASQTRARRFHSFASKFAHFFVDPERFPMKDKYADKELKRHLGQAAYVSDSQRPYVAFVANFQALKQNLGWGGTNRGLDRYLWLAGQYRAWLKNHESNINSELRELFTSPPDDVAAELASLLNNE
jgi:hypothetical protein